MSNWNTNDRALGKNTKEVHTYTESILQAIQDPRMRPAMERPPLEPSPKPNNNNAKGHRHQETQTDNKKHKENSNIQHHKLEQSKMKKATIEGWKQGFLLDNTQSKKNSKQWKEEKRYT
eukprot:11520761-Ditylum_brightwellii.AAC.1